MLWNILEMMLLMTKNLSLILQKDYVKDLQNTSKEYPLWVQNRINNVITTYTEILSH